MGSIFGGGTQSDFQASNPYNQDYLQGMVNTQGQIQGGQQGLAQMLMAQASGMGANPAQTQYMANTQNNIANAQGMIASQRGLNPALAARMGVNAATNANQQAGLGSALMQQQQQMGAQQQLGGLYGQMQQGNLGYQGLYNNGQQSAQALNQKTAGQNTENSTKVIGGAMNAVGSAAALALAGGGQVPGKPATAGDSPQNDTVHAMLSPGEIVVPRSMAHDPEKAKEFIDHLLKEKGKKKGDYGDVLKARRKKAA